MYKNSSILALIPARAGSKRLPGKNIKILLGKPLIAWIIECAKKSRYIDKIVVSTDCKKIANIAMQYGAQIPFMRPAKLAVDKAKSIDVVTHAVNWLKINGNSYDILILLQPTSPLRRVEDINRSIELLFEHNAKSIVSVCKCEHFPVGVNTLPQDLCMKDFMMTEWRGKNKYSSSQFYRLNGAIYAAFCDYIIDKNCFFGDNTYAYIMPEECSVDIDREIDFKFVEFLVKEGIVKL